MSERTPEIISSGAVIRQSRLSDRVAEHIVETIVERGLMPGDALPPERDLAGQFGVSRTVVREAVRSLDARGLLEVRAGSRIRVAAVDAPVVHEAFHHYVRSRSLPPATVAELSDALIAAAAELAASRAGEDDLGRIVAAAEAARRGGGEAVAAARADREFRDALLAATHNELFALVGGALTGPSERRLGLGSGSGADALLAALKQRDASAARQAMLEVLAGDADTRAT